MTKTRLRPPTLPDAAPLEHLLHAHRASDRQDSLRNYAKKDSAKLSFSVLNRHIRPDTITADFAWASVIQLVELMQLCLIFSRCGASLLWSDLVRTRRIWALLATVFVGQADDIVFTEVTAGLNLDQFERNLAGVGKPVNGTDWNVSRFIFREPSGISVPIS